MKNYFPLTALKWIVLAAVALTNGCAPSPDIDFQPGIGLSAEENQQGQLQAKALQSAAPRYEDDRLAAYVGTVLQRILAVLPENSILFQVTLLDTAEINAVACSNGHIFISRNILTYLNSESELAGLLAHEIAHVALRHYMQQQKKIDQLNLLARRMENSDASRQIREVTASFGAAMAQGFSRHKEIEADRFAVKLLTEAGYNPVGMLKLLEMLANLSERDLVLVRQVGINPLKFTGVFSSHPHAEIRIESIRKALGRKVAARNIDQNDRNRYIRAIDGLVFGAHASDGMVRGGQYFCGDYGIRFTVPAQWAYHPLPEHQLVMWPDHLDATYIHFSILDPKELNPADEGSNQPSDNVLKLDNWGKIEERRINGHAVQFVNARVCDDHRPVRFAIMLGDGVKYIFMSVNAAPATATVLEGMVESFTKLSDAKAGALEDHRIAITTAGSGGTFGPVPQPSWRSPSDENAILQFNGFASTDIKPDAGDLIKWVK